VQIVVFDNLGRKVKTLFDDKQQAGNHTVRWNGLNDSGRKVASGVYFYKMDTTNFTKVKKMLLLK
jgi:flagellar hook assembly protein FlgD